jgi:chromosome partitioning protein
MAVIYAVSMNKGGVGKTSLVTNLAGAIGKKMNKKILIVDTDGQGNSSLAFGLNPNDLENTIYDVFMGDCEAEDAIINVGFNVDLLPANDDMNFLDFDVLTNIKQYEKPFHMLKEALKDIKDSYDYIFIDTPPSMSLVAGNVLVASDKVIIPFTPETFAVKGLIRVIKAINEFKAKDNPKLEVQGVVGMMVQSGTVLHSEMLQQARRYCIENNITMYETIIPKSIRFANSTAYEGKPAVWTDASNTIVGAYYELMKEMFDYGKKKQTAK